MTLALCADVYYEALECPMFICLSCMYDCSFGYLRKPYSIDSLPSARFYRASHASMSVWNTFRAVPATRASVLGTAQVKVEQWT